MSWISCKLRRCSVKDRSNLEIRPFALPTTLRTSSVSSARNYSAQYFRQVKTIETLGYSMTQAAAKDF